ncbi:unnamed protein product, partial [Prorocentrum cordatum]
MRRIGRSSSARASSGPRRSPCCGALTATGQRGGGLLSAAPGIAPFPARGSAKHLVLLHWTGTVTREVHVKSKAIANTFKDMFGRLTAILEMQQDLVDTMELPVPYQYFHLLNMMVVVNLMLWAYAMGISASLWAPVTFLFAEIIFMGMLELASQLADPFGEDEVDFPVREWTLDGGRAAPRGCSPRRFTSVFIEQQARSCPPLPQRCGRFTCSVGPRAPLFYAELCGRLGARWVRAGASLLHGPTAAPTRRGAALLPGALAALLPAAPAAHALEDATPAASSAKFQRVVVNVGDKASIDKEVFFWTEAARMKVISDKVGADGLRSVVLGYPGDSSGGALLEVKLDPAVLKRPMPKLLNYEVMQPTVNALNFVQIGLKGKIMELFQKVQESGGASTNGDPSYIDVESPRGVLVRLLPRDDPQPRVELISLNIEVPAFEPVVKFYQRSMGLQRLEYDPADPPITKFSILMGSTLGGTNLLLSPVPDGRLKDRRLDEFEGVVMTAPNVRKVVDDATAAVQKAAEEAAAKEEAIKQKIQTAK